MATGTRTLAVILILAPLVVGAGLLANRFLVRRPPADAAAFYVEAEQAQTLTDPTQRCLEYPDPPKSHWSRDAVEAYCRYRTQPAVSLAEMKSLVASGRATELDRRLAAALQLQRTQVASRGLLDGTYIADFQDGSAQMRQTIEAWKRQSPNSAFALAASGVAYVAQARAARGDDLVSNTPADSFEKMGQLIELALPDLEKAERIDPLLTPVYASLIEIDGLGGDGSHARALAARGLRADPSNYWIYNRWMWISRPQWRGSLAAMRVIAAQAQLHVRDNPLLLLLLPEPDAIKDEVECGCRTAAQVAALPSVFDHLASSKLLASGGVAASRMQHPALGVIYLSEALRFDPGLVAERISLVSSLTEVGRMDRALTEANQLVALAPRDAQSYDSRAYYYQRAHDWPHLEKDLQSALALAPDDAWALDELGEIYVHRTHEWDKGWAIADRLIEAHPDDYNGWLLRASIQNDQPRAGLRETLIYFLQHFADNPDVQSVLPQMRSALQRVAASPTAVGDAVPTVPAAIATH